MYAIFTMRKLMLTNRVNNLNLKLMQLSQKTQDLAAYSANIADGMITPEEAANSPASLFNRQNAYMRVSLNNARNQAGMDTKMFLMNYQPQVENGVTVQPDVNMLQNSFLKQEMEAAAKNEDRKIAVIEKEIDQQRITLETQLKAAQAELDEVGKAEDAGIKASAPKYSGGNG